MRLALVIAADAGMDRIVSILDGLRNALVAVLVTLSVVALTYAGVRYVIAGGDATGVEKARERRSPRSSGWCSRSSPL
jgi:chloramphenicol 3-O-phosphotransferase